MSSACSPLAMSSYPQFGYSYHATSPPAQLVVGSGQGTQQSSSSGGGVSPPPGGGGAVSPGSSGSPCCEGGRPVLADPVSGQTVCSCQYDTARLALTSYPRPPPVYGTHYPSTDQNPYPSIDSSAFYSPLSNPYGLKESGATAEMSPWTSGLQPSSGYYPYDPTLAAYGYGAGYDLAARRKNATRESTATLKAWLNEHKKNPYPTKGEKIMLAIITKMTLTQVSTWFANARRRLKKENKMTWEPKNKTDDDDDNVLSDCDDKDKDDMEDDKMKMSKDAVLHVKAEHRLKELDEEDTEDDERKGEMDMGQGHVLGAHHGYHHQHHLLLKEEAKDCGIPIPATKPKIWSLADTAACKTPPPPPPQHQGQGWAPAPSQHFGGGGGAAAYSRYGGFFGGGAGGPGAAFPEVQTDTPPQTPPNMKLPAHQPPQQPQQQYQQPQPQPQPQPHLHHQYQPQPPPPPPAYFRHSPHKEYQQPLQQQHATAPPDETAFKPFYKSSSQMNGGFVSPV